MYRDDEEQGVRRLKEVKSEYSLFQKLISIFKKILNYFPRVLLLKPLCVTQDDVLHCCTGPLKGNWVVQAVTSFSVSIVLSRLKFSFLKDPSCKQAAPNINSLKKTL